jgi:hypothetical protein
MYKWNLAISRKAVMKSSSLRLKTLFFSGLSLFLSMLSSYAETALEAVEAVYKQYGKEHSNMIVSVSGYAGDPVPKRWQVLSYMPSNPARMVNFDVENGHVLRVIELSEADVKKNQRPTMMMPKLKEDSSRIFSKVENVAHEAGVGFDAVNYLLIYDKQVRVPVYRVTLMRQGVGEVGEVIVSSMNGEVLHTNWKSPSVKLDPTRQVKQTAERVTGVIGDGLQKAGQTVSDLMKPRTP